MSLLKQKQIKDFRIYYYLNQDCLSRCNCLQSQVPREKRPHQLEAKLCAYGDWATLLPHQPAGAHLGVLWSEGCDAIGRPRFKGRDPFVSSSVSLPNRARQMTLHAVGI